MKKLVAAFLFISMTGGYGLPQAKTFAAKSSSVQTRDKYAGKIKIFEEFVRRQMEKDKIPGLTVGFIKDDYTWVKGFGYADLENKVPAKAESVYRLASVTKPITAAAILQLAEKGKINLDAEIQDYVPYYPKQKWAVTVRQLLGHLGGGQSGSGVGAEKKTVREVVQAMGKRELVAEPGTKFLYTTSGYNLLGAAIEETSKQSFGDYLRENIFSPLGMKDTRLDDVTDLVPNRVRGYRLVNGEIKNAQFIDVSTRFGGGGVSGTVPDMLRFAKGLNAGQVISAKLLELMQTPMANKEGRFSAFPDADTDYAMGWFVQSPNGHFVVEHGGSQAGVLTDLFVFPYENFAIAIACNREDSNLLYGSYVRRLYELVMDERWVIPVYRKDRQDAAIYAEMARVFDHGLANFGKSKTPLTTDTADITDAFAYFNRAINQSIQQSAYQESMQAIVDGLYPKTGQTVVKVGSYMAAKLNERFGAPRLKSYHQRGAIDFFADYIEMYKADTSYPKALRFDEAFETLVMKWRRDWDKTWNEETRRLKITPDSDLEKIGALLRKTFAEAETIPNFVGDLLGTAMQSFFKGDDKKALQASTLAVALYPQDENANFVFVLNLLSAGKKDEARNALKKVLSINPSSIASANRLKQNAEEIAGAGKPDVGIRLLLLGIELYHKEAGLYDALGNLYLKKKEKEPAAEYYKKALEVDPNFAHAKEMLKNLLP